MYDSAYILVVVLHVKLPAKKLVYIIYKLSERVKAEKARNDELQVRLQALEARIEALE